MKSRLPEGWKEVELGEVTDYIARGITPKYAEEEGIKVLNQRCIRDYVIDHSLARLHDLNKRNITTEKYLQEYDILINSTGVGTLGRLAQIQEIEGYVTVDSHVTIVRGNGNVDKKFLNYSLINKERNIENLAQGSTGQTELSRKRLSEEIRINIPSIKEQKAIADTLSSLDNKIETNNKINKNLEQQAQEIFKHWFVDFEFPDENGNPYKSSGGAMVESELGMIPEGWKVGRFEDIVEFSNGYGLKSKELSETPISDGYRVFKMGDIKVGGGLNPNKTKHWISTDYLEDNKLQRFLAKKGDLLMCMTDMKNNMKLLGHTALVPIDDIYVVNQRVGHITTKNDIGIDYPYLYILTNSDIFIDDLRGRSNSGVQVNLTTTAIKETKVILGDNNTNLNFDKIIKPMIEKSFLLEQQNQKLSTLRDTLLPKLMSGEIRIPLD